MKEIVPLHLRCCCTGVQTLFRMRLVISRADFSRDQRSPPIDRSPPQDLSNEISFALEKSSHAPPGAITKRFRVAHSTVLLVVFASITNRNINAACKTGGNLSSSTLRGLSWLVSKAVACEFEDRGPEYNAAAREVRCDHTLHGSTPMIPIAYLHPAF